MDIVSALDIIRSDIKNSVSKSLLQHLRDTIARGEPIYRALDATDSSSRT